MRSDIQSFDREEDAFLSVLEGRAAPAALFSLLVVLNTDLIGNARMALTEVFIFSAANDFPRDRFLFVFNQPRNHWRKIKTAVSAFFPHAFQMKTGVITGREANSAGHQDWIRCLLIIGHAKHDV